MSLRAVAPLVLVLSVAGCDATYTTGSTVRGMVRAAPPTDPAATPDFVMARRACGLAVAGPQALMRLEHERPAPGGAMTIIHVRPDPASEASQRWRCYFDYGTRRITAYPV